MKLCKKYFLGSLNLITSFKPFLRTKGKWSKSMKIVEKKARKKQEKSSFKKIIIRDAKRKWTNQ
jgi:hypothetical protein